MTERRTRRGRPEPGAAAAALTSAQLSAFDRFPDDNPNPVLRYDDRGDLIYANPASAGVRRALGTEVGGRLPDAVLARFAEVAPSRGFLELTSDDRIYAVWPVPIASLRFTNLYGTDVTAERAIVKFPDQNPNPVLRIDRAGALVYANPASARIVRGLGLTIGRGLPEPLRSSLLHGAAVADGVPYELDAEGSTYAVLPVDVPGFGFINVYGTDITAVREKERLAAENERLLLNILPEPIAERLRSGEALIADRFDDVTLLFADIVEFTRLSSTMTPAELVGILNEVFTAFDTLADEHGLEKVKTIGDAYMVVGGLLPAVDGHTARVATMALDLARAVARIEAATRLGIAFRIGIHCGPVVAGVIGRRKFIYDIWGDTVNVASRMESLGIPGRIQVTHAVAERLRGEFELEARGLIDVKGKGPMPAYFLVGHRGQRAPLGAAEPADRSIGPTS